MSEGKHTELPWTLDFNEKAGTATVLGPLEGGNVRQSDGLGTIAVVDCSDWRDSDFAVFPPIDEEHRANAAFIVKAANSHEALKEVARAHLDSLIDQRGMLISTAAVWSRPDAEGDAYPNMDTLSEEAREELALLDEMIASTRAALSLAGD